MPRKNKFYPFDELNDGEVIFDEMCEVKQQIAKGSKPFQFTPYLIVSESEIDCLEDANAAINSKFKSVIDDQVKQREEGEGYEDDTPITQSDIDGVMDAISQSSVGSGNKLAKSNGKGSKGMLMGKNLDNSMTYFHHRIDIARDQVLRYARWKAGEELFFSDSHRPNVIKTVPNCPKCNAPRRFEFQIMPQLLTYLNIEDVPGPGEIDWGGLYIYTCTNSCQDGGEEFCWCQPSK